MKTKYCITCPNYYTYFANHQNFSKSNSNLYRHPDEDENPIRIQSRRIEERKEYIIEHLKIPKLEGIPNKSIQDNINTSIESDILEFKRQMEEAAIEKYEKVQEEGRSFDPYVISTIYEFTYNEDNIISMSIIYHQYINKANYYIRTAYNYNIKTGKSLALEDLFKKDVDYITLINNAIKNYIKVNPQEYSPETIEEFEGITPDQPFFLEDRKLAMFFGFHQIAPTEAKIPIIKIPFSVFRGYLRPELLV